MHLAQRAYVLVLLTAVLCVVGIWSEEPALAYLWHIPAALLLLGLALEGWFIARLPLEAQLSSAPRAFPGRPQPATFQFANGSPRPLAVHYAPAVPAGFETLARVRRVRIAARGTVRDPVTLLPVRLGPQPWPTLPARVLGPLRLAWWTRPLDPHSRIVVAPDALRSPVRPRGLAGGARPRRVGGAGGGVGSDGRRGQHPGTAQASRAHRAAHGSRRRERRRAVEARRPTSRPAASRVSGGRAQRRDRRPRAGRGARVAGPVDRARRRRARGPGRGPAPPAAAARRPGGGGAGGAARAGGVRALRGAAPKAARVALRRGIRSSHASRRRRACASMPRSGTA